MLNFLPSINSCIVAISGFFLTVLLIPLFSNAQLSGDYTLNANFYDYDEDLFEGDAPTQYKREHSSAESWLFLNYRYENFEFTLRHDIFHNSPLHDPQESFTEQGIGFFSASVDIEDLSITAGSFYDQFGSGMLFRAFEERTIGLDYAIEGVRLQYDLTDDLSLKGFTGQQKNRFSRFDQVVTGLQVEHFYNKEIADRELNLQTEAATLNRTLNQSMMDQIASEINNAPLEHRREQFEGNEPKHNVYGGMGYFSANYGNFTFSSEFAGKTGEAIRNPSLDNDLLIHENGYGIRKRLGYSQRGLGINLRFKYTDHLSLRSHPYTDPEEGILNYVPSFTRQHAYRLTARYAAANHEPGEAGLQLDATWSPERGNTFGLNFSHVTTHNDDDLFSEAYLDYERRWSRALTTTHGLQALQYNQRIFEGKPEADMVEALTMVNEANYRLNRTHSLRTELQYLYTEEDLGDFAYILLEWNISPNYSFSVSDMINTRPQEHDDIQHFYSVFASYRHRQTRFTLSYSKQPEGVVCTGGVCRVEPAFSGVQAGVTTNF